MKRYREELHEVLLRLAAPAEEQIQYLKMLGTYPSADELALELHELALMSDAKLETGEMAEIETAAMLRLNSTLDAMSGQDHLQLWDAGALVVAPEWAEVRNQASECLALLYRPLP